MEHIGRSNDPIRRAYEHRLTEDWITSAARIDLEWVPADIVHELERRAIESSAEVSVPTGNGLAARVVIGAVAGLTAKWGLRLPRTGV